MYHGNRMLVDHARRLADERAARAEQLRSLPAPAAPRRSPFAALLRLGSGRSGPSSSRELEATSG